MIQGFFKNLSYRFARTSLQVPPLTKGTIILKRMARNCVFCQICGDNPSATELLFTSDDLVVFRDIKPAAEHHYLVVTREHIADSKSLSSEQKPLLEKMIQVAKDVLEQQGCDMTDVRLGFHWPPFHSVSHLHLHAISPASQMGLIPRIIFKPNSWWFVPPEYVLSRL